MSSSYTSPPFAMELGVDVDRRWRAGQLGVARRRLLRQLGTLHDAVDQLSLLIPHADPALPLQTRAEAFDSEIAALGLSSDEQSMAFYRAQLDAAGVLNSATL